MKCVHCGRQMFSAWVVTRSGPVGPKCGRALGLDRPHLPKINKATRRASKLRDDKMQIDWISDFAIVGGATLA